ncbi:uncharacterized protein LOC110675428 [Aedes aegypti]|uniref:Uncharacterized protein n=1 Tax=Aedes aegypti TaxID=7159 RepID=A0A6I8U9G8_AEDAE|nr:uncharacterized protein LOC110675428 [Aedes aegypti]
MTANNYSIVQTIENEEVLLSVLPSRWILKNGWKQEEQGDGQEDGCDLCFWPKGVSGYRLLEKAKKDPKIPADNIVLRTYRCKIKRNNFALYSEAFRELKLMEIQSDTDEPKKKLSKTTTAAELFKQIQSSSASRPGTSSSHPCTGFDQGDNDMEDTSDLDESLLKTSGKREDHAMKIRSMPISHSQPQYKETKSSSGLRTPILQNEPLQQPNLLQLVLLLHEKVDNNTKQIDSCVESVKQLNSRNTALLSQINAKLDVIATQTLQPVVTGQHENLEVRKIPLIPVKCLADMESLEKKSKNDQFVRSVIQYLGSIHGKQRYVGEGLTVCLQIINYFLIVNFS